jgi:hypothetical protein
MYVYRESESVNVTNAELKKMEIFSDIIFSYQRDSFDYESTKSLIQRNGGTIAYRASMARIRLVQPGGAVNIESGNYVDIGFVCDSDAAGQLMDIGPYIVNKANTVAVATLRRLGVDASCGLYCTSQINTLT